MTDKGLIEIQPTGPNERYTDISLASIFATHIGAINSLRQAMWQIFAAMVVANAFPLSFLAAKVIQGKGAVAIGFAGMALCLLWYNLNHHSWEIFWLRLEDVRRYSWPAFSQQLNPFVLEEEVKAGKRPGDPIYKTTRIVIFTYIFLYWLLVDITVRGGPTPPNLPILTFFR